MKATENLIESLPFGDYGTDPVPIKEPELHIYSGQSEQRFVVPIPNGRVTPNVVNAAIRAAREEGFVADHFELVVRGDIYTAVEVAGTNGRRVYIPRTGEALAYQTWVVNGRKSGTDGFVRPRSGRGWSIYPAKDLVNFPTDRSSLPGRRSA